MADVLNPEQRHRNMSAIRSQDTKPELFIRKKLFSLGYRYRKNYPRVPGRPDIWLARYRTAVFVHGCYWHRHEGCRYAYIPKTRVDFWKKKFEDNVRRDRTVREELAAAGIRCLVVWECSVRQMMKSPDREKEALDLICGFLASGPGYMEI